MPKSNFAAFSSATLGMAPSRINSAAWLTAGSRWQLLTATMAPSLTYAATHFMSSALPSSSTLSKPSPP